MENIDKLMKKIKLYAKNVEKFIYKNLSGKAKEIWDASNHYIKAGGKRLRPFIVIKSFELLKDYNKEIIPIAASIEILHTFTLIHDDIMDQDAIRRNVATIHTKWSVPIAILAGDLLYAKCFTFINNSKLSNEIKSKISASFGKVGIDLSLGQYLDNKFEEIEKVAVDKYFEMIKLKTGALFSTSAIVGGIANEMCSNEQLSALNDYGINLGIAFQLIDDILGIIAIEEELGKPIGSDLREGKKTFLVLYAKEILDKNNDNILNELLIKPQKSENEIEKAISLIKKTGALKKAKKLAKKYSQLAISALKVFPESEAKEDLINIAILAVEREY